MGKRKIWGNNPPKVDWLHILWKCHDTVHWPSKAESFVQGQELDFGVWLINQQQVRHYSGKSGHKRKVKKIPKGYTIIDENSVLGQIYRDLRLKAHYAKIEEARNATVVYHRGQPDLECDDPLFDGNPVF